MRWYKFVGMGIVISVLILAAVGRPFIAGRTGGAKHIAPQSTTEPPDMRVQNMHLIEQAETGDGWKLLAHEAEFYTAKQLIVVRQVQAQLLAQTAQPIRVEADHGHIDSATGNITVEGHVQLQYLEGYTLETDVLHWHATSRILRTDATVKIDSALVHIGGKGLQGHVDEQRFVLQDDVHAAFQLR